MEVRILPPPESPDPRPYATLPRDLIDPDPPQVMARRNWLFGCLGSLVGASVATVLQAARSEAGRARRPGFVEDMLSVPEHELREHALLYRSLANGSLRGPDVAPGFDRLARAAIDARDDRAAEHALRAFAAIDDRQRVAELLPALEGAGLEASVRAAKEILRR